MTPERTERLAGRTARPPDALSPRALRERLSPWNPAGSGRSLAPWTPEGLARLVGVNGVGLVLLFAGWYQASGEVTVRGQLTWLNVGLAGLGVAGFANGTWLLRGRQAVGLGRAAMLPLGPGAGARSPAVRGRATPSGPLVAGRGMSRYHLPSCAFVEGRTATAAGRHEHEERGLVACPVCRP